MKELKIDIGNNVMLFVDQHNVCIDDLIGWKPGRVVRTKINPNECVKAVRLSDVDATAVEAVFTCEDSQQ